MFDRDYQEPFAFYFRTPKTGPGIAFDATPTLLVYKSDGTSTATGATITEDVLTGFHRINMATTDSFYVADDEYNVTVNVGAVNGIDYAGVVLGEFSIGKVTADNVWFVSTSGLDANTGRSRNDAKLTIAGAISAASDGDIIHVANGTYSPSAKTTVSKAVHIRGDSMIGTRLAPDEDNTAFEVTVNGVTLSNITVEADQTTASATQLYCIDAGSISNFSLNNCFVYGFHWAGALNIASSNEIMATNCTLAGENTVLYMDTTVNCQFNQCRIQNQSNNADALTNENVLALIDSNDSTVASFERCTLNMIRSNSSDDIDELIVIENAKNMTFKECDLIAGAADPDVKLGSVDILETSDTDNAYLLTDCKLNVHNASAPANKKCIRADGGSITMDNCNILNGSIIGDVLETVYLDAGTS